MKFVFPGAAYEEKTKEFFQEFRTSGSSLHGVGGLDRFLETGTYGQWLQKVYQDMDLANIPEGRVPAYTCFYVRERDGCLVGMISIRLALNDFLRKEGGHIGYCIRPSERGKGYGTQMLREALKFCRPIGLNRLLLVCDKSNLASAKVIQSCGGILETECRSELCQEILQRYWIDNK